MSGTTPHRLLLGPNAGSLRGGEASQVIILKRCCCIDKKKDITQNRICQFKPLFGRRHHMGEKLAVTTAKWGALFAVLFVAPLFGCGDRECGVGTVEKDGVCEAADDVLVCASGFIPFGNRCEPAGDWIKTRCGNDTKYDENTRQCLVNGGGGRSAQKRVQIPKAARYVSRDGSMMLWNFSAVLLPQLRSLRLQRSQSRCGIQLPLLQIPISHRSQQHRSIMMMDASSSNQLKYPSLVSSW